MTFYDIFNKKKKEEKPIIIADNRERNTDLLNELKRRGIEVKFEQLPIADYICGDITIERKTVSDLKSSIINKRLIRQLEEIKQYPKPLLIIEGIENPSMYEGGIHVNAFRGLILSLIQNHQIPILWTQNAEDTARYMEMIVKSKKKNSPLSLRPSKIFLSDKEQMQFILEGFPGIGPVSAKKLIQSLGSMKAISNASEEDLQKIIGKKASLVYKIMNQDLR